MKSAKNGNLSILKFLLCLFLVSFLAICIFASKQNNILKVDTEGLAQIEYINSCVQRISKLELENSPDDTMIAILDVISEEIFPQDGKSIYFVNNEESYNVAMQIVEDWYVFKTAVYEYREENERNNLFVTSENNYNNATDGIKRITFYIEEMSKKVEDLNVILIVNVLIMALLLIKILIDTLKELNKNKELSKDMFIDLATGLYNRSKCQEIMKSPVTPDNSKERAVIIFDLNDLKKTNDLYGHRAGDQLISCFAEQVKKATNIFPYETFVGRYGGDEFMAYFDSIEEKDVQRYLDEVDFLMKDFNETQNKEFKLSCAAGYSITTEETKDLTMRELFDQADSNMYQNKITMKEKIRKELREKGIEEVETIDDRML